MPLNSTAADIMTSPALTIGQSAKLQEAALTMLDRNIGCLPVVDDGGNYVGIVTDDSFFPQQKRVPFAREKLTWVLGAWVSNLENLDDTLARLASHPVSEGMMQRNSVTADTPLQKLAELMLQDEVHHLVVTSGDKVDGVVSRHDLAKLLLNPIEGDS